MVTEKTVLSVSWSSNLDISSELFPLPRVVFKLQFCWTMFQFYMKLGRISLVLLLLCIIFRYSVTVWVQFCVMSSRETLPKQGGWTRQPTLSLTYVPPNLKPSVIFLLLPSLKQSFPKFQSSGSSTMLYSAFDYKSHRF